MSEIAKSKFDENIEAALLLLSKRQYKESRDLLASNFDGKNPNVALYLGHIYQRKDFSGRDLDKSIDYFRISANAGNLYGIHALITALREKGSIDERLKWMEKGSELGSYKCSFDLFHHFKRLGDSDRVDLFLQRAVDQGSIPALQNMAIRKLSGHYGFGKIPEGLIAIFSNIPTLFRYLKEREKQLENKS